MGDTSLQRSSQVIAHLLDSLAGNASCTWASESPEPGSESRYSWLQVSRVILEDSLSFSEPHLTDLVKYTCTGISVKVSNTDFDIEK